MKILRCRTISSLGISASVEDYDGFVIERASSSLVFVLSGHENLTGLVSTIQGSRTAYSILVVAGPDSASRLKRVLSELSSKPRGLFLIHCGGDKKLSMLQTTLSHGLIETPFDPAGWNYNQKGRQIMKYLHEYQTTTYST